MSGKFRDKKVDVGKLVLQSVFVRVGFVTMEGTPVTCKEAEAPTCTAFVGLTLTLWPPLGMMRFHERIVVWKEDRMFVQRLSSCKCMF